MNKHYCAALLMAHLFFSAPVSAEDDSLITLSIGHYDALDDREGADFRLEYRPDKTLGLAAFKPWAGGEVSSDGAFWIGGGILYDYNFVGRWYLTPNFGAGLYDKGSSDVDLDYPLQFRTQLELSYEFESKDRLGATISHMSNADLGDSNPGTEVIAVQYSLPIDRLY